MLILMEGIVLCFILLIFCVIGIANGAEKFTVFYEKDEQEKEEQDKEDQEKEEIESPVELG